MILTARLACKNFHQTRFHVLSGVKVTVPRIRIPVILRTNRWQVLRLMCKRSFLANSRNHKISEAVYNQSLNIFTFVKFFLFFLHSR